MGNGQGRCETMLRRGRLNCLPRANPMTRSLRGFARFTSSLAVSLAVWPAVCRRPAVYLFPPLCPCSGIRPATTILPPASTMTSSVPMRALQEGQPDGEPARDEQARRSARTE